MRTLCVLALALLLCACGAPLAAAPRATNTPEPPIATVRPFPSLQTYPAPERAADVQVAVSYRWVTPDAAHSTGIVTWSGGPLVKCRSTQCAPATEHGEPSGVLDVPGPGAVDYFWRPLPGDRYCVAGMCATVPSVIPVYARYLPLVSRP